MPSATNTYSFVAANSYAALGWLILELTVTLKGLRFKPSMN